MSTILTCSNDNAIGNLKVAVEANAAPQLPHAAAYILRIDPSQIPCVLKIEMDVSVPDKGTPYHAKGILRWYSDGSDENRPGELGIEIIEFRPGTVSDRSVGVPPAVEAFLSTLASAPVAEAASSENRVKGPPVVPMPSAHAVKDMLKDLVGTTVIVREKPGWQPVPSSLVAYYATTDKTVLAWVACSCEWACVVAGALTAIPAATVKEAIDAGVVSESFLENAKEVLNIFTNLLNSAQTPHLTFQKMAAYGNAEEAKTFASLCAQPAVRLELEVEVEGYGTGSMSLWTGMVAPQASS